MLFPSQQMLQYVSRDATLFIQSFVKTSVLFFFPETCEVAQLFSTVDGTELVIVQDGEMLSKICHLECVIRSPFRSQSVSVQCSVSLPKKRKKIVSQTVVEKCGRSSERLLW